MQLWPPRHVELSIQHVEAQYCQQVCVNRVPDTSAERVDALPGAGDSAARRVYSRRCASYAQIALGPGGVSSNRSAEDSVRLDWRACCKSTLALPFRLVRSGPHFAPKAKHVIFLFMTGGPSHMDLLDPKPALRTYAGQRPESVDLRTERMTGGLLPSPFEFRRHGQSGIEVSELLPKLAGVVDELCVIRSMYTFNPTHTPARNLIHTGNIASTRPSLGAWISYGLGTENQNLPGFVVLSPAARGGDLWRSGFLPAEHQGTHFNHSEVDPEQMIRYLRNDTLDAKAQREQLDLTQALNRFHMERVGEDAYLDARIQAMETAYRMQFEALDVFDVRKEPGHVRQEYGETPFANGCLLARRLVERGVRYVHVYYGPGQPWDDHKGIKQESPRAVPGHGQRGGSTDQGLERARTSRRNPDRLGRRVRAHASVGSRRRARPQSLRLHHVDGRRRCARRRHVRRDR